MIWRAVIVAALLPCAGFAQWSPCWTNGEQFKWYDAANEANSAAVERCQAAGCSITTNYAWGDWFKQRSKLVNAKANLKRAIPYFILTNMIPTNVQMTVTGVCASVGAPTNYLDSTPFFNLASSSNGWMFFDDIAKQLTTTSEYDPVYAGYVSSEWWAYGYSSNRQDAITNCFSSWTTNITARNYPQLIAQLVTNGTTWEATAYGMDHLFAFTFSTTNIGHSAQFWLRAGWEEYSQTFDQQGTCLQTNLFVYTNLTETYDATWAFFLLPDFTGSNVNFPPNWPAAPDSIGFEIPDGEYYAFVKWDGTNGFRYK